MKSVLTNRSFAAAVLLGTLVLAPSTVQIHAQTTLSATQALLDKAHALELRGRIDMAGQTWQQVLLADPNNTEALGGLARAAKFGGNAALANTYLDRLRAINPNDPGIARVENMGTQQGQTALLQQAGKLAEGGQYAKAMTIYRQVFGNNPPPGDWALAYYETESATDEGRTHAISGLRALVEKYPADSRYQVALGRILTYSPATRTEGRRYLERHAADPAAVEALRQSLVWDSANPASAAEIKAYLAKHNDAQLATALRNQPRPSAPVRAAAPLSAEEVAENNANRARGQQEQEAYNALNANHLEDAEIRFKALLASDANNPRALAGLGYVRMKQANFGGAVSFLEQAKQNGARDSGLETALSTAHFWVTMGDASTALNENDLTTAEQQFQAALALRPASPEALEGLGGTLLKAQQPDAAIPVFERYVKAKPTAPAAWRGLFMAQYAAGSAPQALLTEKRIPTAVHSQLMRDPDFLRTLASAYSAVGRDADAQRVLHSALELPFPADSRGLKVETQLQYAALLQQANHIDQAAALFKQVLVADASNTVAWQGLIRAQHSLQQDTQALQTLQGMPPSSYEAAMRDPGFQTTVASVYQSQNKLDIAQEILEKAVNQQMAANQKPGAPLLLQLAGIYLQRNDAQRAFPIYRQILTENSDRPDAWKGLLSVLHSSNRDQEALAQIQQIPAPVRHQLEGDVDYLQTVGAVYNGLGQPAQAMIFLNRVQQHYAGQHTAAPAEIDVQDAWLLFNGGNDAGLYRQLMLLGGRPDLTDQQRRTVQTIWTNWAVRRANQTAATGNTKRSLAILNAAAKSFPDNPGVLRALASGYARAGLPKQAVTIFRAQDMTAATASDYKAAVGAALASDDPKDAETWLRFGLDAYPRDADMLTLAAKFEQARGNSTRAADYFRASLAALPPSDPGAELATELSRPMPVTLLPTPAQPQDLATLLSTPGNDAVDAGTQSTQPSAPYLPSFGNAYGQAPVQINQQNGHSSVVPSYMANPAARNRNTPTTLGSYSSQVSASESATRPATTFNPYTPSTAATTTAPLFSPAIPVTSTTSDLTANFATDDYQRRQIQRANQQAQSQQPPLSSVPQPEIFGNFVPYDPTQHAGFTPTPVPVQLGDATPRNLPVQRDVTDVLPTARYALNAPATPNGPAPDFTNTQNRRPTSSMIGQSNPPHDTYSQPAQTGYSDGQQYPQPTAPARGTITRRNTRAATPAPLPASSQPAMSYPSVAQPLTGSGYPTIATAVPQGAPPTDADLMAKNLPPLRGSYNANASAVVPLSQRQQTELQLNTLEASYSAWIGGTGYGRYRSGTTGLDRLTDLEVPFEMSAVLGKTVRGTIIPRPVFLNSGVINTASFANAPGTIPVLGTLSANAAATPAQQFATGIGGEFQLTTKNIGLALGYTPYGFLVTNVTGRLNWRPGGGHFSLFGERDSVKDTQLSYAGLRDPGSVSAVYAGNIWGGVISTGGGARLDMGTDKSGYYVSGGGYQITGYHVLDNRKYEGTMGAYFRVKQWPGYGSLNVGTGFYGNHYDHNERGMTYGQGGYFSPNIYFLASVPVTFNGSYKTDFHYTIAGTVGVQTFQEEKAPYYPLDVPLQTGSGNAQYGLNSNTGLNYSINSQVSYRVADHWYLGGFLTGNNTNNYNTVSGGFFVRYLFKSQYPTEDYPTGLFPTSGFRPLRVP